MALNINGTTGISGVDASVSAPALQGTDSNTGISFGSDTIKFSTGGVERMAITNSGVSVGGKVVQFVQAQSSVSVETTSSSYQTFSQIQLAITPTSATNLLFAQLSVPLVVYEQNASDANSAIALTDDNGSSYYFQTINRIYDYGGNGSYINWISGGNTVNTAGSTSERTYKVRYKLVAGDKVVINSGGSGLSILTIMEIEP